MFLNRHFPSLFCAILVALSGNVSAEPITLSGTVLDKDNKPLQGVLIWLVQAKKLARTNAQGEWSVNSSITSTAFRKSASRTISRNLHLADGSLRVRFDGRDISGRGMASPSTQTEMASPAFRTQGLRDTLQYRLASKIILQETMSEYVQSKMIRVVDSTINPSVAYTYFTDTRDTQTYRSVAIGPQVWMAQNLNYAVDSSWWYRNNAANGALYGRLYQWAAAMGLDDSCNTKSCSDALTEKWQGACPSGWHVPTESEWTKLVDTTLEVDVAGTNLKATGSSWRTYSGTNLYGFGALPSGARVNNNSFTNLGGEAIFWSTSVKYGSSAWFLAISNSGESAKGDDGKKSLGLSLRCLHD